MEFMDFDEFLTENGIPSTTTTPTTTSTSTKQPPNKAPDSETQSASNDKAVKGAQRTSR